MSWGHVENRSEGHQPFQLCSLRCSFPIDPEASGGTSSSYWSEARTPISSFAAVHAGGLSLCMQVQML